jgi:hypothetical protein
MNIQELIPTDRFISKPELMLITGHTERNVREMVSQLKETVAIIGYSSGKGWRRAKHSNELKSKAEIEFEIREIDHTLAEIESRKQKFNLHERSLIAHKAMLEKKLKGEP